MMAHVFLHQLFNAMDATPTNNLKTEQEPPNDSDVPSCLQPKNRTPANSTHPASIPVMLLGFHLAQIVHMPGWISCGTGGLGFAIATIRLRSLPRPPP
jgi:hypothetical protein